MPYVKRDSEGRIVGLYGSIQNPMFTESRTWISSGKLEDRLAEYPAFVAEAERLGMSLDDAHDDLKSRWPEWIDSAELWKATQVAASADPDPIEPEAEPDHDLTDGIAGHDSMVYEGSPLAVDETVYDDPGGDVGEAPAFSPPDDPDLGDAPVEPEVSPANFGGVLVSGDPLKAAQMEATWIVGDLEADKLNVYDVDANLARLNELRGIALAIKEGVHPAFTDEAAAELQALESFATMLSNIRTNADNLRNAIRQADSVEAVEAIDLGAGWPE